MLAEARKEPDMYEQMLRCVSAVSSRWRRAKERLNTADSRTGSGVEFPPHIVEKMQSREAAAKNYFMRECDWRNTDKTKGVVTRKKVDGSEICTDVDLEALERGDWHQACSRHYMSYHEGLCAHILAALREKVKPWQPFMRYHETSKAWRRQASRNDHLG